jgi:multiple sugar transport system substrate-binding protein
VRLEQRLAIDELITRLRAGRVTRRTFLECALATGLSSVSAFSLLESCGSASARNAVSLIWQGEYDASGTYQKLVNAFNQRNQGRIHVSLLPGPNGTNDLITIERNMLKARSAAVDIFSIDIIYVAEFAQRYWLQPISENRWPQRERAKYLRIPLHACTFNGQLWAVPIRSDVGLLYYRSDLVPAPPSTWEELASLADVARGQAGSPAYGYIWQGAQYEGLICNFDEILHGYGGSFFQDLLHPTVVTIHSTEAIQALTTMYHWIGGISPPKVTTYTEEVARFTWESGQALFMRNWPYAYALSNDRSSGIAGRFATHSLLSGGRNHTGYSSLGGWQLGINTFSQSARKEAAWEFIQYMVQPEAQRMGATAASWVMVLQSLYKDQEVLSKVPFYRDLMPILNTAVPRPVTPNYASISPTIQFYLRQALLQHMSPSDALSKLAEALKKLISPDLVVQRSSGYL